MQRQNRSGAKRNTALREPKGLGISTRGWLRFKKGDCCSTPEGRKPPYIYNPPRVTIDPSGDWVSVDVTCDHKCGIASVKWWLFIDAGTAGQWSRQIEHTYPTAPKSVVVEDKFGAGEAYKLPINLRGHSFSGYLVATSKCKTEASSEIFSVTLRK